MAETFDPGAVIMQFGALLIQGFAEGDMIRVEPRSEGDTLAVGSGGETARVKSRDKSATVTAILMDTHPINIALIAYHNLGNVAAPLSVSDPARPRTAVCPDAFLTRIPGVTYSNGVPVREWVWLCPKLSVL